VSQTRESSVDPAARTTDDTSPAASENSARSDTPTRGDDSARSAVSAENAQPTRTNAADLHTTVTAQGEVRSTAQPTDIDATTPKDSAEPAARSDNEKPKDRADDAADDAQSDSGSDDG
jgi:hypothetical protein